MMMEPLVVPRCLSAEAIDGAALISFSPSTVSVEAFRCETAATTALSWPVAILKASAINEFLLDDIDLMLRDGVNKATLKKLDEYFRSSSLYLSADSPSDCPALLLLTADGAQLFFKSSPQSR